MICLSYLGCREVGCQAEPPVIPSGGPTARRRGIAILPTEGPLSWDDGDSSPPPLRGSARNDKARRFLICPLFAGTRAASRLCSE